MQVLRDLHSWIMCNPIRIKEPCLCCRKAIQIGNTIAECEYCDSIIHSGCFSASQFALVNDKWACKECELKVIPRYNPFKNWNEQSDESDPKPYESYCGSDMAKLSSILEKCRPYTIKELNDILPNISDSEKILSSFFLNIDGNFTNFDHLQVLLKSISHSFSAIGLAETNICPQECAPYIMPGYVPFYQSSREGKKVEQELQYT